MGNTLRPIWTVTPHPNSYPFSCHLKICGTSRYFSIDSNLGLDRAFHFHLSAILLLEKYSALNFQLSQAYKQGYKQGNEQIPPTFLPREDYVGLHPLAWKRQFTTSNRSQWIDEGKSGKDPKMTDQSLPTVSLTSEVLCRWRRRSSLGL